jgi:DNA ligase-1
MLVLDLSGRSLMDFKQVTIVFEEIDKTSGRTEITRLLADLLKKSTPHEANIICNLSLGLLRPPYQGTQFNFAEKNLIKVTAQLLDKSEATVAEHSKHKGDLGLVVQEGNWHAAKHPTITHVYDELCAIEKISGTGSQEEKTQAALLLLKSLDPLSAKYVVRVMLGTLRLGFSDMTIIDALSWMEAGDKSLRAVIEHAYNICVDIGLIAQTLKEKGKKAIEDMQVTIGIPIRPAAAERLPTAKAIVEKLGHCIAQPKLDGFRLQIHIKKSGHKTDIHFFSRNLQDMSYMFPDIVEEMKKLDVKELICEGEAIAYDEATDTYLPFQETVKRKRKHGIEEAVAEYPLHVPIFDLLYLNGESYMDKTHEQRRKKLLELFHDFKNKKITVIEEKEITTAKELEEYFLANIESGLEGLVVKKPDSIYQPGKRNFNWIKLKRQEEGHLDDTIDVVVLGYYAGSGKRAAFGVGAFLVGVYNKEKDAFQTVAKVGSGLTDDGWKQFKHKCDKLKVDHRPARVECAKELTPDVWTSPEIVCVVRADEITMSPTHTAGKTAEHLGYALRFPRFIDYRSDKSSTDATTAKEIKHMYEVQRKK